MTGPAAPAVDPTVFAELRASVGDDEAFVVDLVQTYVADAAVQLAAIERALGAGDAEALVRPAHSLKTSSRTIGAMALGEISRDIEMTGRSGSIGGAGDAARAARAEWQHVEAALAAWLDGREGA